ncbi:hypothetical protein CRG98_000535 [Punica granatum]|uniref:Uncharacterized protein n=1 Tax=Punica granatum TaxID=22663 RepID=A0A2I0LEE6_PUNGR|nr:hypothetical protein CRG98_000535 [Punica granatum]
MKAAGRLVLEETGSPSSCVRPTSLQSFGPNVLMKSSLTSELQKKRSKIWLQFG